MEMAQQKLMRQQNQMNEIASKTQINLNIKEDNQNRVQQNKKMAYMKTKSEAMETKTDKQMNREQWELNRRNEEERAHQIKTMIKMQQHEAQTKRQMEFIDRQHRTRAQIEEKMNREAHEQAMYEGEVARMEREELDLIMRLKNTKLVEEQAH